MPRKKTPVEPSITLSELKSLSEKFNNEPWTFPSISQKRWLTDFVKSVEYDLTKEVD